jgi:hypothetical protein
LKSAALLKRGISVEFKGRNAAAGPALGNSGGDPWWAALSCL